MGLRSSTVLALWGHRGEATGSRWAVAWCHMDCELLVSHRFCAAVSKETRPRPDGPVVCRSSHRLADFGVVYYLMSWRRSEWG